MKKIGTLNASLSRILASMGHTDRLVVCDCGLPIPDGKAVVDLALTAGIPRFIDTLRVILEELEVEEVTVAEEIRRSGADTYRELQTLVDGTPIQEVSHNEFKRLTRQDSTIAFVRTGEATPYANVILTSGVTFG